LPLYSNKIAISVFLITYKPFKKCRSVIPVNNHRKQKQLNGSKSENLGGLTRNNIETF